MSLAGIEQFQNKEQSYLIIVIKCFFTPVVQLKLNIVKRAEVTAGKRISQEMLMPEKRIKWRTRKEYF